MPSNLPPGVTDSMIPGNRPEDIAFDNLCEEIAAIAPDVTEEEIEALALLVLDKCDICERAGYQLGEQDAKLRYAQDEAGADL